MDDAQFIGILVTAIGIIAIPIIKQYLDLKKERAARLKDREVAEAMIEYIKAHRDALAAQPHQTEREIALREQELQLERERFEWDQLVGIAKTAGWIIEKAIESEKDEGKRE